MESDEPFMHLGPASAQSFLVIQKSFRLAMALAYTHPPMKTLYFLLAGSFIKLY